MRPESAEAIIEIARSAFVTLDADGRVLEWNRRATELFGYAREDALGSDLAELIVPERYRERHRAGLRRARSATGGDSPRLTVEAVRRDGSELPVEVSISVVGDGDEPVFHAWIDDVSERTQLLRELEAQLRGREPGFGEILDALAEAVTIRDPHDHILYANRAAFESMGFTSLEDMQRRPPQSIFSDYIVQGEHGEDLTMDAVPSVRLLAGEPAEPLTMRTINRSTGELRWQLLKAAPLHDDDGRPVAAVTIIEDITRERTAELRDRFLARATETLMSSIDYEETLRNVAWLAVPEVADWCAVELVDERGTRQRVAVAHRDPAKLELAERLRRFEPEELDPTRGVGRILRTGASELYPDIPDEVLAAAAINEEHLTLLRSLGFRSVMLVPLRARGRTFGVMTLVTAESMRRFAEADLEFAEQVAARAAVAVDNALLATARRHTVATLQRSLLPDVVPELDGWNVATFYRAAHAIEEIEVGGDFFDFYETDDAWIVLLGDVTGKGVEAAALTSLVRHGARFLSKYERSPSRILVRLDEALSEQRGLLLCTAVCVRLERKQAVIASAGHPAPLIVRDDGRVREVGTPGPILGAGTGKVPADRPVPVAADETLLLYTDGVLDTLGERERFGAERLRRLLVAHAGGTPDELLSELEAGLDRFQAGVQADDTAALALRPEPVAGDQRERAKHLAGELGSAVTGIADRIPLAPRTDVPLPAESYLERVEIALTRDADAPARARGELRQAILGRLSDRDSATATLLTSELVTNAVIHPEHAVGGSVGLRIATYNERIRVEVTNEGPGFDPRDLQPRRPREAGGHGLVVVDGLASRWGTTRCVIGDAEGFCVWFELDADAERLDAEGDQFSTPSRSQQYSSRHSLASSMHRASDSHGSTVSNA